MSKISAFIVLVVLFGSQEIIHGFDVSLSYEDALYCTSSLLNGDWSGALLRLTGVNAGPTLSDIFDKVDEMSQMMEESFEDVRNRLDTISQALNSMMAKLLLDGRSREVAKCLGRMKRYVKMVFSMKDHYEEYDNKTLLANIEKIISETDDDSMIGNLELLASIVTLDSTVLFDTTIYDFLKDQYAADGFRGTCDSRSSYQQKIIRLHDTCVYYELQGLKAIAIAHSIRTVITQKKREFLMKEAMSRSIFRMQSYFLSIKAAADGAWTEIMRCNPSTCAEGENYIQMKGLFTPIIINENYYESNSDCQSTCSNTEFDWKTQRNTGSVQVNIKCSGTVHDCHWIDSPKVCLSEQNELEWVSSGYGWYGNNKECGEEGRHQHSITSHVKSFWRCDTCVCTCGSEYDDANAQKFMSLRPITSDIENNMVVIGVKWVQKWGVGQWQIQQAAALSNVRVNGSTVAWKHFEGLMAARDGKQGVVTVFENGKRKVLEKCDEIMMFDKDRKTIHFDYIAAPRYHVVTGIKWASISDPRWGCKGIEMHIRSTPYDIQTGQVDPDPSHSVWITPEDMIDTSHANYRHDRKTFNMEYPGETLDCDKLEPVTSGGNWATEFGLSSRYGIGLGDPVVPVFDSRENIAPTPLGGVELSLRSCKECLAFVTTTLYAVDMARFIQVTVPDSGWDDLGVD